MVQKNLLQIEVVSSEVLVNEIVKIISETLEEKLSNLTTSVINDPFVTRQQVADLFQVSLPTIHSYMHAGILKPYKIGSKTRFLLSEVRNAAITP